MPEICSQITFFYYKDLAKAADFYERIMGFELADDQGTCRIYRVRGSAFLGIVDERYGHCSARKSESSVLATFVVDNVREWHEHLRKNGVTATPTRTGRVQPVIAGECEWSSPVGGGKQGGTAGTSRPW